MQWRTAKPEDLPQIRAAFAAIIERMNRDGVPIWDDSYPAMAFPEDIARGSLYILDDGGAVAAAFALFALEGADDVSTITTDEVSKALGGVEINECANVGAVTSAVAEESNEVGTVYYSDTYGLEDKLDILEVVPYDLTGDVIYPIAEVVNKEADDAEKAAAVDFIKFLVSDDAKAIFRKYYFDTNVEN